MIAGSCFHGRWYGSRSARVGIRFSHVEGEPRQNRRLSGSVKNHKNIMNAFSSFSTKVDFADITDSKIKSQRTDWAHRAHTVSSLRDSPWCTRWEIDCDNKEMQEIREEQEFQEFLYEFSYNQHPSILEHIDKHRNCEVDFIQFSPNQVIFYRILPWTSLSRIWQGGLRSKLWRNYRWGIFRP